MGKRGSSEIVSLVIVFCALMILAQRTVGESIWSLEETMNNVNRYYSISVDKEVQFMKQGFIKSAVFMSLNSVAKELAEHGGYNEDALVDFDNDMIADPSVSSGPPIMQKDGIPFWTVPDCGNILKRVPYLKDANVNFRAGDILVVLIYNDDDTEQYIEEVNAGEYPLYVSLEMYMLKPGKVNVECRQEDGCLSMESTGITPSTITRDGVYTYKVTGIESARAALALHVTGTNSSGETDYVVRIKQVLVSIHNPDIIGTPNTYFTNELENYYVSMRSELNDRNDDESIQLSVAPIQGVMTKGYLGFVEGTAWPDEDRGAITGSIDDPFFPEKDLKLTDIRDSGLVTEETKLRYYIMYGKAKKFTDISENLLGNRLWEMLDNEFDDSADEDNEDNPFCTRETCPPDPLGCPRDPLDNYNTNYIVNQLDDEMESLTDEFNDQTTDGITWNFEVVDFNNVDTDSGGTCNVNVINSPVFGWEYCTSPNFEYYEYQKGYYVSGGCCNDFSQSSSSHCDGDEGMREDCVTGPSRDSGNPRFDCIAPRSTVCYMHYRHRFVLKDLKVKVTLTDTAYRYYDTDSNNWNQMQFTFYVTAPLVDDNCCDGIVCSDEERHDTCSNPYNAYETEDISDVADSGTDITSEADISRDSTTRESIADPGSSGDYSDDDDSGTDWSITDSIGLPTIDLSDSDDDDVVSNSCNPTCSDGYECTGESSDNMQCCELGKEWDGNSCKGPDVLIVALRGNLDDVYSNSDITFLEYKISALIDSMEYDGLTAKYVYLDDESTGDISPGNYVTNPKNTVNIRNVLIPMLKKLDSKYLLIIGGHSAFPSRYIGEDIFENKFATYTDDDYVDLDNDMLLDIPVGRFPDSNNGDINVLINSIDTATRLHDSGGLDFSQYYFAYKFSDTNSIQLHDRWTGMKCDDDPYCDSYLTDCQLSKASGKKFVSIDLHGSVSPPQRFGCITEDECACLFQTNPFSSSELENLNVKESSWFTMTCFGSTLSDKDDTYESIPLTFFNGGGATYVGCMGTTYIGVGYVNDLLDSILLEINYDLGMRIGDAVKSGKILYSNSYHSEAADGVIMSPTVYTYRILALYGDPTLKVNKML